MWVLNKSPQFGASLTDYEAFLGIDAPALVRSYPTLAAGLTATPLYTLRALAKSLGLRSIYAKDEGCRLGLGSFKALGGSYAVARLVQTWACQSLGRDVAAAELLDPEILDLMKTKTIASATDGNHGRSVAAGARLFGCKSVIFVHSLVLAERVESIRALGAEIVVVQGSYDECVEECSRIALREGWQVVSDTSWPGYETIPVQTMQGYTVMVDECISVLAANEEDLSHIFIQGGCGGLAAAVAAHFNLSWRRKRPKIIIVEPQSASCLMQSARAGRPVIIEPREPTVMGMLECYQPSMIAWQILERRADAFMEISDSVAITTMRRLASPLTPDPIIVAGESGGAGLGGLCVACQDIELRAALDLTSNAAALVFISEGATAPRRYEELVGMSPSVALFAKAGNPRQHVLSHGV
jgi:diaminopropionate ammonia-lyase